MKVILFGFGSIGQRHYANLKALRPDCEIYRYDPPKGLRIIDAPDHYDAAIIASPTALHADHIAAVAHTRTPFYCEKPLGIVVMGDFFEPCAVGHQYRFHAGIQAARDLVAGSGVLHFRANDDLVGRYGPDVDGIMAAHPIDTALWLLGPARKVKLASDGVVFDGEIDHERGSSTHHYVMNRGPRTSTVTTGSPFVPAVINLDANNEMYLDALETWLRWVEGWPRDPRTCTLAEGVAVMEVLAQVKHVSPA